MKDNSSFKRSLSITLGLFSLCIFLQANAQSTIDEKAIMSVVDASIKEYRVYATCMSLDEYH